ncbi:MAG: hypothetical protein JKX97_09160 [Candidatus Lindowbacteria bacterium]|nr:hypothetical protein [Candidatus Lindowbacteria bacterium]
MSTNLNRARPRRSSNPPPKTPLIGPTGNVKLDVVADVINRAADGWGVTPPAEQGVCGVIAAGIGAGLGTFGAPIECLETGFAVITADLAAMIPGQPAATVSVTTIGLTIPHAHAHPPSFGVPLPGLGPLTFGGSQSVAIGGEPAARAGDLGLGITCCGFAPAYECFTGSSNTFIGGSRAARRFDIIRQCDPTLALGTLGKVLGGVGLVAGAAQAGAESSAGKAAAAQVAAAQAQADALALAISATLGKDPGAPPGIGAVCNGVDTVLIGGMPTPDILDMFGGLLKVLKKAKGGLKSKPRPKARKDEDRCTNPGEPVDPATGNVFTEQEDFIAPETGFRWVRWYLSAWNNEPRRLGLGFRHTLDKRLVFNRTHCLLLDYDGSEFEFPCTDGDAEIYEGVVGGYRLSKTGPQAFEVHYGDEAMRFECTADRLRWSEARLAEWICGGLHLQLVYDRRGRLSRIRESVTGKVARYETDLSYDRGGRITTVRRGPVGEAKRVISTYSYDERGRLFVHTDALGGVSRCEYDRDDRLSKLTNRNGYSFRWTYDSLGRCTETTGDDGLYACMLEYEPGRTIVTKGDGGRWTYVYDRWNVVEAIVDPYGGTLRYEFDDESRIIAEVDAGGSRIEWIYDQTGRLLGRRDPFGNPLPTRNEDPNYRPRRETEPTTTPLGWHTGAPQGSADFLRVPVAIRPRLEHLWHGQTASNAEAKPTAHDGAGRISTQPNPSGGSERYVRDAEGNAVERIDSDGAVYLQQFTGWNLPTIEEDPEGRITRFEFDGEKNATKFVDPGGTVTEYPRDLRGRIDRVIRGGRVKERYEYDLADHLTAKYDKDGRLLCAYEVGEHGLQTTKTLASGDVIDYAYDRGGRIVEATTTNDDGETCSIEREHDLLGAVLSDTRDGVGVRHSRTPTGKRSTTVLDRFRIAYQYGDEGEWSVQTPDGTEHTFQHHDLGFTLTELGNGTRELSCFDAVERCAGKVRWRGDDDHTEPDRSVRYQYSPEGELHCVEDSVSGTTRYAYDRGHRLVHEVSDANVDESWEYDAAGNIVTHPDLGWATYAPGNRLKKIGGEVASYDDRDNLIELRRGIEWTRYAYDSLDNLARVQWSDREKVWTAAYDGLGRRTWKQYGEARTEYYWDDDRLAAEITPNGKFRLYVYASADAFVPFLWLDYDSVEADPSEGTPHYIFTNQIGAPIRIEDAAGNAVWVAERYQAYGELTIAPGASIECNLRWPGHIFDPETGLHCNRYRYYSPRLGRYIQTDPLGVAGGLNTHAAPSNPVATVDLLGLAPACQLKAKADNEGRGKKTKPDAESVRPEDLLTALGKPAPQRKKRLPQKNGRWEGDPGNGRWFSNNSEVIEITRGKPVEFINDEPNFTPWSEGSMTFKPGAMNGTGDDFRLVYEKLAHEYGFKNPTAAKRWLSDEGLTPHHKSPTEIELIPSGLHGNTPHTGSASGMRSEDDSP